MRFYICFFYRFSSQLLALNSEQYGTLANAYFLNSIKVRRDTQFLTPSLWEGWGGYLLLHVVQLLIIPILIDEALVGTTLHDTALVKYAYLIGVLDGRQAMGDSHGGTRLH